MAKKTVITKLLDPDTQSSVIEFPQNRTLYVDQFTDDGPYSDEGRAGYKDATSMKDVFEHYQPQKDIKLSTEEGEDREETFVFKSIKDFEDNQLIAQSELMSKEQNDIDAFNAIIHHLEHNKTLQKALKDDAVRNDLKNALEALLAELNAKEA